MQNGFIHFYNNWIDFGELEKLRLFVEFLCNLLYETQTRRVKSYYHK